MPRPASGRDEQGWPAGLAVQAVHYGEARELSARRQLAAGIRVDVTSAAPLAALAIKSALHDHGIEARLVDQTDGDCDGLVLTEGMADTPDSLELHQTVLVQVQAAHEMLSRGGAVIAFQQVRTGWTEGVSGLIKTAGHEYPNAVCRTIEVCGDLPDQVALGAELVYGDAAELRFTEAGIRTEPILTNLPRPAATAAGDPGTWLVTGGGRGVTAACAIELARRSGGQFILIGRSQLADWPDDLDPDLSELDLRTTLARQAKADGLSVTPRILAAEAKALVAAREVRDTLAHIDSAGGEASYLAADISDAGQVRACIRAAERQCGPITGLIHGAGVLADKRIIDKTPEQVAAVFAPKVLGLRNLLEALDLGKLRHLALFSSAAGRFGNPGQADYAMANEVLAGVAESLAERHPGMAVKSIAWGPWAGGMVDPALKRQFEVRGVSVIPLEAGAEIFCDLVLDDQSDAVEICVGGALTGG